MRGTYFLGDTDVVRPSPQHPPCRYEQQQHSSASSKNGTMVVVVSAVALGQMLLLSRDGVRLSSRLTPCPLGLSPALQPLAHHHPGLAFPAPAGSHLPRPLAHSRRLFPLPILPRALYHASDSILPRRYRLVVSGYQHLDTLDCDAAFLLAPLPR